MLCAVRALAPLLCARWPPIHFQCSIIVITQHDPTLFNRTRTSLAIGRTLPVCIVPQGHTTHEKHGEQAMMARPCNPKRGDCTIVYRVVHP